MRLNQSRLFRLGQIFWTGYRFGLLDLLSFWRPKSKLLKWMRYLPGQLSNKPLWERVRLALECLGPIFVKFGQLLSIRPDLLPYEYIQSLKLLQDQVLPFSEQLVYRQIQEAFKREIKALYMDFDPIPIASASVAQVHHAWLRNANGQRGQEVAVKILRPNIQTIIEQDLALFYWLAKILNRILPHASRLHIREIIVEFDQSLHSELNLMQEAANTSQLKHNFSNEDPLLLVPEVYFDYCSKTVLTMQWMQGMPILDKTVLRKKHIDPVALAHVAVTIFFTQVFKHGFFHADMHPGNLLVNDQGQYIVLDCGIIGTLSEHDKYYLALNFLALFNRDYHRVATAHIECGWMPDDGHINAFESAIRSVCEPIFQKPLSRISFGDLLMQLFEVSRTFKINIQPQLILLQKTLMYVESLGRELDPMLNIWAIAQPFLAQWMKEQVGWRGFLKRLHKEMPDWVNILPAMPKKMYEWLSRNDQAMQTQLFLQHTLRETQKQNRLLIVTILILSTIGLFCLF
ncbi:MAG: 2-polyprenylphenol 6-hydroxylase [Neisseriales bacterium]|nr:MAG: 2-polyprenylphenol 6-hydroxylase [Neisseriales bacterium]